MQKVAIIGGCRTPFVKAGGLFATKSSLDLGIYVTEAIIEKLSLDVNRLEEIAFSTVLLNPRLPNFAREIVLRSKLPKTINAHFVSNNCISGMVAISMIAAYIQSGRINCGLAGGSESMSNPALSFKENAEKLFLSLARVAKLTDKLKLLLSYKAKYIFPDPPSPKEPSTGLTMGEHCELSAKEFQISRAEQDEVAFKSHYNAARAQLNGILNEEIVAYLNIKNDNIIRADTNIEKLAKLKPVFDKSLSGSITAGNSSALTDGASIVCLMSEKEAKLQNKEIIAFLEDLEFAAINSQDGLLMAPVVCLPRLLKRNNLTLNDIDIFEIHEAFAAQVLANLKLWEVGWEKYPEAKPIGKIPFEKINLNGGSIAIGHPFAATGGRLLLSAVNALKRTSKKYAVISICAAGGMAAAALVSRK